MLGIVLGVLRRPEGKISLNDTPNYWVLKTYSVLGFTPSDVRIGSVLLLMFDKVFFVNQVILFIMVLDLFICCIQLAYSRL